MGWTREAGDPRAGRGGAGRFLWIAVLLLGGMVLAAGIAKVSGADWFGDLFRKTPAETARAAGVVETAGEVKIPLKALDSGKAVFLRADIGGKEIHYFALKSSDGVYRAAYDTCDVASGRTGDTGRKGTSWSATIAGRSFRA